MINKRLVVVFFIVVVILTLAVLPVMTGCAESSPAEPAPTESAPAESAPAESAQVETIELKWLLGSDGFKPEPGNTHDILWLGWSKGVEEASGGRVKFTQLVGAAPDAGIYDGLIDGVGDVASNVIMLNTGRFPCLEIMSVPDLFTRCQRPSKVANALWAEFPEIQEEFSEVKVLACFASGTAPPGIGITTRDKPVYTLEDAKGMKMGAYGIWGTKLATALGFVPVAVPPFEVYESLQRGIVDGSFMDVAFLTTMNVAEVVEYWHSITLMFCPFYLGVNWDTWNSLPSDVQKIMEDVATEVPDWSDADLIEDVPLFLPAHPEITEIEIAPEEQARWRECQDPVQQEYIDMLEENGIVDGQKIFDRMLELFEEYAD